MTCSKSDLVREPSLRYLLFGGINTLLSFSLFVGLGVFIEPHFAYAVSFSLSVAVVALYSNRFVYRGPETWRSKTVYVIWYLGIFSAGHGLIVALQPVGIFQLVIVGLTIVLLTAPLTFLGGRFIFRNRR